MTWAVFLALLGIAVVVAAAWLLGRPRSRSASPGVGELEDADAPGGRARPSPTAPGSRPRLRGYRMDQVDAVVDSLEARIAEHDLEIARLRGEVPATAPAARRPPRRPRRSTPPAPVERRPAEDGAAPSTRSGSRP